MKARAIPVDSSAMSVGSSPLGARLFILSFGLVTASCAEIIGIEDTVSKVPIRGLVWFFPKPLVEDTTIDAFILTESAWSGEGGFRTVEGVDGRGDLFFDMRDCQNEFVSGVSFETDLADSKSSERFFFLDFQAVLEEPGEELVTDDRGAMGQFNLPTSTGTVSVVHPATEIVVSETTVFFNENANTTWFGRPNVELTQAQADQLPGDFSCMVDPQEPVDPPNQISITVVATDVNQAPVEGIRVRACSKIARGCAVPEDSGLTDADGMITLNVSSAEDPVSRQAGFQGYLLVTGDVAPAAVAVE